MMLKTNISDQIRRSANEESVSVIHAPESFRDWVSLRVALMLLGSVTAANPGRPRRNRRRSRNNRARGPLRKTQVSLPLRTSLGMRRRYATCGCSISTFPANT